MNYLFVGGTIAQAVLFRDIYCSVKQIPKESTKCLTWAAEHRFCGLHPADNKLVLVGTEYETTFDATRGAILWKWREHPVERYSDIDDMQHLLQESKVKDAGK